MKKRSIGQALALAMTIASPYSVIAADTRMSHGHEHGNVATTEEKTIELYGSIYLSLDYIDPGEGGNANPYLDSHGTIWGIKGNSPINSDLKLFWQIESNIEITELGRENESELAGRDSFIGVQSKYGNILAGKHLTPYTWVLHDLDPFHHTAGDFRLMLGNVPNLESGNGGHHSAAFNIRAPDIVIYQTPSFFGGLQLTAGVFAFNETTVSPLTGDTSAYSVAAKYQAGPLVATLAYEQHNNYDSYGDAHGDVPADIVDTSESTSAGLMYSFTNTSLAAIYEITSLSDEDEHVPNESRDVYYLNAAHRFGANTIKAAYGKASELAENDGGSFYAAGLSRSLSKVTEIYVIYVATDNDLGADFGTKYGPVEGKPAVAGGDPTNISAGIIYNF